VIGCLVEWMGGFVWVGLIGWMDGWMGCMIWFGVGFVLFGMIWFGLVLLYS
jgi:hypothetical protein